MAFNLAHSCSCRLFSPFVAVYSASLYSFLPLFIGFLFFVAPYLPLECFSFRYKLCVLARLRSRKDLCNRLLSVCIHALSYSVMFLYARFASNIRFVQCYSLGFLQVCTLWEFLSWTRNYVKAIIICVFECFNQPFFFYIRLLSVITFFQNKAKLLICRLIEVLQIF